MKGSVVFRWEMRWDGRLWDRYNDDEMVDCEMNFNLSSICSMKRVADWSTRYLFSGWSHNLPSHIIELFFKSLFYKMSNVFKKWKNEKKLKWEKQKKKKKKMDKKWEKVVSKKKKKRNN